MKKTEATGIVFKVIDECIPGWNMWEKEVISERILNALLEAGLQPPIKRDLILHRTTNEWDKE